MLESEYECKGLDCIDAVGVQVVLSACAMVSVIDPQSHNEL